MRKAVIVTMATCIITACGGGGNSSEPIPPPENVITVSPTECDGNTVPRTNDVVDNIGASHASGSESASHTQKQTDCEVQYGE